MLSRSVSVSPAGSPGLWSGLEFCVINQSETGEEERAADWSHHHHHLSQSAESREVEEGWRGQVCPHQGISSGLSRPDSEREDPHLRFSLDLKWREKPGLDWEDKSRGWRHQEDEHLPARTLSHVISLTDFVNIK